MSSDAEAWMRSLIGQVVVVDLDESYLVSVPITR
jgi:hypothetical protein